MSPIVSEIEDSKVAEQANSQDLNWEDVPLPPMDLPEEDGEPLEDVWHRHQMNLLIDSVKTDKTGKEDFFAGGNMFVYFMLDQVEKTGYKGPDFFYVKDVDPNPKRGKWVVWVEDGRYPDVIIELLSPSTRKIDLNKKKSLYEKTFKTYEYYCFDHKEPRLYGWRISNGEYKEIQPDEKGFLDSLKLGYKLGAWKGKYLQDEYVYLRFFSESFELIPTHAELAQMGADQEKQRADQEKQRADQEKQRADQEKQRADQLEREVQELRRRLQTK
jgi:Uma2 family endonuclease